jgi:histidyl-tRNA synthetase
MYKIPKGCIDYYGDYYEKFNYLKNIVTDVFETNGAKYLDTPVFELKSVLMNKYGEEAEEKLIYDISDNGGEKLSLRYDLTIPFIRHIKENRITKMRRYSIGKVYRRDAPNIKHGRFREFYQTDFDILGEDSTNMMSECTIFDMIVEIMKKLSINDYTIYINHTDNLKAMLIEKVAIPENDIKNICSAIDKLDKCEFIDIIPELCSKGLNNEQIILLEECLQNNTIFSNVAQDSINTIKYIANIWGFSERIIFTNKLARGLDYYNGIIFEVKVNHLSSIMAGGRYDNIIPCTSIIGFSIGLTRILTLNLLDSAFSELKDAWNPVYNLIFLNEVSIEKRLYIINWCKKNISKKNYLKYSDANDRNLSRKLTKCIKQYEKYFIVISEEKIINNETLLQDLENKTYETIYIDI